MKKILVFLGLLILPAVCMASFSVDKWHYYKDINPINEGLTRFSLDEEIFANSKKDLSDLRIIDGDNQEIPYKMMVSKDKDKSEIFYPKMLNNSFIPGQYSSAILELKEGEKDINRLKIITGSENFQRNVKVYGSDDREVWNILKDNAYIYDYTDNKGNFKSQNTIINFPQSVFRYIKVEISDLENNPVKISNIEAIKYISEKSKEIIRYPKFSVYTDTKEKFSEIILDMDFSGIPTGVIEFSVSGENFNRGVLIYTSNDKENWKYNTNGYIFRYRTNKFNGENLKIDLNETSERYIKVVIKNQDNLPLDISNIKTFSNYREVIFQSQNGKVYKVYYGNEKAKFPQYDLESYFQYLDLENVNEANLSSQNINRLYSPDKEPEKPFTERIPYLFPAILVVISLVLLYLVYKFFQKK